MKKRERRNQNTALSLPLPLAGQPNLRKLLCVRQYVQTISGKIHAIPDTSINFDTSPGVALLLPCPRLSPSSFPLPNALQRTSALFRTKSLPRGSLGTQELFVTSGPVAGIIKKIYG